MKCRLIRGSASSVRSDSDDAEDRIASLRKCDIPVTLVINNPCDIDLIRAASYSADSTLHAFVRVPDVEWAAPYLAAAGRCGIRSAVTLYPIVRGAVSCADVLEMVSALSVNYRQTFLFMFPKNTESDNADDLTTYIRRFMSHVRLYMECTQHTFGICGTCCDLCAVQSDVES